MKTQLILKRPVHVSHENRLEKEAVRRVLTFERFCRDNALWEAMRTCYIDESYVHTSWFHGSGPDFIEALSKNPSRAPHHIHSILVWTHGNRSVAIMETTLEQRHNINEVPVDLVMDVQILYRLVRLNGEWYVAGWTTIYEKDNLIPAYPTDRINLHPADFAHYRQACQCHAYIQDIDGAVCYQDQPGQDRPETVDKLYEEADKWLLHG